MQEYFRFWSWSSTISLYYTTLILIYDVLYSFRLYYIHFKEFKIFWGPGDEDREPRARYEGWGTGGRTAQRPISTNSVGEKKQQVHENIRGSQQTLSMKIGVLKNLANFTGKHLCQPPILLKKRFWHWCFLVNFAKFRKASI